MSPARTLALPLSIAIAFAPSLASGTDSPLAVAAKPATYADLADLADGTPLVIKAQVRKVIAVDAERARGVRAGYIRTYVEARTEGLIGGNRALGEQLLYLADVKADSRGKLPSLKKVRVILFARPVAGRPAELQLVAPDAQLIWNPDLEARTKAVLTELYAADAPQKITGVREALYVGGTLAGEGETQVFLSSASGEPAALSIARAPGRNPVFNASFSELVGSGAGLPARDTLAWYRLACFLPAKLPVRANIAAAQAEKDAAAADYEGLIQSLGPCPRTRS